VWDENFCRAGRSKSTRISVEPGGRSRTKMEMNGDERRWRWRTEREIISGSFVGREREQRQQERERAGQEATKERREESFLSLE
jgi:hypothetical protein